MDPSLLHLVKKPSRYLGCERNAVRPSAGTNTLHVGLAFPDLYEIGMSHLGMALLYHSLNRCPGLSAERVFLPAVDFQELLRNRGVPLSTLESRTPLHRLDVLGFTLAYELTYTNVLAMLDLGNIPLRSAERTREHPVILAGGPCAFNPEPLGAFIDAFIIGEAEFRLPEICELIARWKAGSGSRDSLLHELDRQAGVYVPSRFTWKQDPGGGPWRLFPSGDRRRPVRKCTVRDLDASPYPEHPVVPFTRIVHDRISIEAARGCPHGCRFCQASVLYRPYRERSLPRIRDLALAGLKNTGYGDLSLLALSIGDHTCLDRLTACLMQDTATRKVALSLPSMRVGSLAPSVVDQVLRVRKTGFTLAPEAATERLRDVINKDIDEAELFRAVRFLASRGWRSLKLYFMIGLPTEQDADVEAIVRLSDALQKEGRATRSGPFQITVNVSTFVPKAHTPFQWEPQLSAEEAWRKQAFLKKRLHRSGFQLKLQDARLSLLEGLFARGDRTLCDLLEDAYRRGCMLDGWTEHLRFDRWEAAFAAASISPEAWLHPYPDPQSPLPWSWIDTGVDLSFLLQERHRAHLGEPTPIRCEGDCARCGLCSSEQEPPGERTPGAFPTPPALAEHASAPTRDAPAPADKHEPHPPPARGSAPRQRFRIAYSKTEPCALLSHLETINVFYRALRRSGLPVCYTEGEHPQPRISFSPALPVGIESVSEHLDLWMSTPLEKDRVKDRLGAELPEGFALLSARDIPLTSPSVEESILWVEYEFRFPEGTGGVPGIRVDPSVVLEAFRARTPPVPAAGPTDSTDPTGGAPSPPSVRIDLLDGGCGLRCRIHKSFASLPSPLRVLAPLLADAGVSERNVSIRKTHTAFLAFFPAATKPGRRSLPGRQGGGKKP